MAKDGCIETEQRNKFSVGERIEIMKPDGSNPEAEVLEIRDAEGTPMESAPHPQQKLLVKLSCQAARYDILRRRAGKRIKATEMDGSMYAPHKKRIEILGKALLSGVYHKII